MATAVAVDAPAETADRAPSPVVVGLLLPAAVVAAAAAFWLTLRGDDGPVPFVHAGLVGWIVLAYVACGVVAWWRRPRSRLGPLMVAAGFAPAFARLEFAEPAILQAAGDLFRLLPAVLFLHVFLAYPSGLLERRLDRRLVGTAYAVALGLGVVLAVESADGGLPAEVALGAQRLGVAIVVVGALASLVGRWRSAGVRLRGSRAVLVVCFVLALAGMATGIVLTAFGAPGAAVARWTAFGLIGLAPVLFLLGLLRRRVGTSFGELLVGLQAHAAPAQLERALARTLRDPSLTLAYWLPEFRTYADVDGRAVALPAPGSGRAATPITRDGVRLGALVHDPALAEAPALLDAVTAAAAIALENGLLHVELKARLQELRGSRARILSAGQRERQRLERNLHDGAQQRLIALSLELSLLADELVDDPGAARRITVARGEIAASLSELRDVAQGLHPAVVSGHGLSVALEQLAARAPVPVRLSVRVEGRLPETLEVAAYYLVSESLANVGKYARADSARVDVAASGGQLVIEVVDDGVGGADTEGGTGLRGLADRVEALDGRLRVWSPLGGGTRVRAEIPCAP